MRHGGPGLGPLPRGPSRGTSTPTPPAAAEAVKGPRGTVVESLGQIWLFTIAEPGWRPPADARRRKRTLPVDAATDYTAVYMESIFDPGMTAATHTHSGPEAFFTLTGAPAWRHRTACALGAAAVRVVIVPAGPPMLLTATGAVRRRGVVLILHDSSQPATTMVHDWVPKGLCKAMR